MKVLILILVILFASCAGPMQGVEDAQQQLVSQVALIEAEYKAGNITPEQMVQQLSEAFRLYADSMKVAMEDATSWNWEYISMSALEIAIAAALSIFGANKLRNRARLMRGEPV